MLLSVGVRQLTGVCLLLLLFYSNISKAFDCVDHDILLSKLACYGAMDNSLVWFTSYLSSRMQSVSQGSILDPLLFSIYVNDLPTVVHNCQLNMYVRR